MHRVPRMAPTPPVYLGGVRVSPPVPVATYFGIASVAVVAISLVVLGMRTTGDRDAPGRRPASG